MMLDSGHSSLCSLTFAAAAAPPLAKELPSQQAQTLLPVQALVQVLERALERELRRRLELA